MKRKQQITWKNVKRWLMRWWEDVQLFRMRKDILFDTKNVKFDLFKCFVNIMSTEVFYLLVYLYWRSFFFVHYLWMSVCFSLCFYVQYVLFFQVWYEVDVTVKLNMSIFFHCRSNEVNHLTKTSKDEKLSFLKVANCVFLQL